MTTDAAAVTPPTPPSAYPVRLSVDYPEGPRNRLTTLVRIVLAIPIIVILALLSGSSGGNRGEARDVNNAPAIRGFDRVAPFGGLAGIPGYGSGAAAGGGRVEGGGRGFAATGASVGIATALMLLFRRKYPRWWFDWNRELARFGARVCAYVLLLRDEYPSTDEEQAVHLDIRYPDVAAELNRGLPLVKWLLAIPHYIVLAVLGIAVAVVAVIGWFIVLFTGQLPPWLFDFIVGFLRWGNRVTGYAYILVTDVYPPFRLAP
jgi:hypothetical protein